MYIAPNPYPSQDAIAAATAVAGAAAMTPAQQAQMPLSPQQAQEDKGIGPAAEMARQSAEDAERARRMVPVTPDPDRGRAVDTVG